MKGRTPKPWYRTARKSWFVVIDGERVNLGPDKAEAFRRFHALMAGQPPSGRRTVESPPSDGWDLTFAALVERYLADLRTRTAASTQKNAANYLQPFVRAFGPALLRSLRKPLVDDAVRAHGKWGPTAENLGRSRLLAALNWAVETELIDRNPLAGLRKPCPRSRGREAVIAADHSRQLIDGAPPYLRDILIVLRDTGCRPCEVLSATAADFDRAAGALILVEHKTAHSTGGVRVIHMTPEAAEVCARLADRQPTGSLFRRKRGTPFPDNTYLPRKVRELREKLGLPESVIPYGFRHTFATDALGAGEPDALVAELLGHKGTGMLHRHYAHLTNKAAQLRAALNRVRPPEQPPATPT